MGETRLLLASPDEALRRAFDDMCHERGFEMKQAGDEGQFHALRSEFLPTLIVLDLDGELDGMETLKALAKGGSPTPVVLTGACQSRIVDAAHRVGLARGLPMGTPLPKSADARRILRTVLDSLHIEDRPITGDDIELAIDTDDLQLYYMPLKHMRTGTVHSAEALLRWNHPDLGTPINPTRIVSVAENHGLMRRLTRWVIEHALKESSRWAREGWTFKMAVNVSSQELLEPGFVADVRELAAAADVPTDRLILELTESAALTERVEVLETVTSLRLAGVELGIDDFGKGYSSLDRLRRMPFSELKIDKDFVLNAFDDDETKVICKAMIDLGHSLGMDVVAEGVASRRAWELVDELGCDVAQGFFVGEPLPVEEFDAWLERWGVPSGLHPVAGARHPAHGRHRELKASVRTVPMQPR